MPVEKVPTWLKQVLMPELNEIKGELKAINTRIDSTNERIESLRNETKTEINSVRSEIASVRKEIESLRNETKMEIASLRSDMNVKFDSLEKRIPVIEKMAVR